MECAVCTIHTFAAKQRTMEATIRNYILLSSSTSAVMCQRLYDISKTYETRGALREVLISRRVNRCSRKVCTYTFCGRKLAMIETKMAEISHIECYIALSQLCDIRVRRSSPFLVLRRQ